MVDITAFFNLDDVKPKPDILPDPFDCDRQLLSNEFGQVLSEYLELDINNGPWLAGGAVRKSYLGIEQGASDWDIWFRTPEQFKEAEEKIKKLNASMSYSSNNAISYKFQYFKLGEQNIQLIRKSFYDTPEQIIKNFDFSICQLVTDGKKLVMGDYTARDLRTKTIRLTHNELPTYIISRLVKYMVYGYQPNLYLIQQIENNMANVDWTKAITDYDTI